MKLLVEVIGWASAVTIVASYLLLSMGKLSGRSVVYQWMNVIGASGFVLNSGYNGALPSAALNIIWATIGVVTLAKIHSARAVRT